MMNGIFVNSFMRKQSRWLYLGDSDSVGTLPLGLTGSQAKDVVCNLSDLPGQYIHLIYQGKHVRDNDFIPYGSTLHLVSTLPGGKGGFGSMLRAIGAQIEKTTNREACRDLSGRRLRDINEEKRLKQWIAKKAERERQVVERRRARLERLRSRPKYEFHDPEYERLQSELPDRIDDALDQGMKQIESENGNSSRKACRGQDSPLRKKPCLWLGVEDQSSSDSDESCSKSTSGEDDTATSSSQEDAHAAAVIPEQLAENICHLSNACDKDSQPEEPSEKDSSSLCPLVDPVDLDVKKSDPLEPVGLLHLLPPPLQYQSQKDSSVIPKVPQQLDLLAYTAVQELESLGLDRLKEALTALGMKCGGTLQERAGRLWSVRGMCRGQIPPSLLAKPLKNRK